MDTNDKAIAVEPELITFEAVKINGQHVLKVFFHTGNIGSFVVPATPVQAQHLAASLLSYVQQVAEYDALHLDAM
jgi:hypothetical protein